MRLQTKSQAAGTVVIDDADWPFADPPNFAVIVDGRIFDDAVWIYFVGHDEDDGGWQFHGPGFGDPDNAKVVGLGTMLKRDPSIRALADLPLGWFAWRETPTSAWHRNHRTTEITGPLSPAPDAVSGRRHLRHRLLR